MCECGCADQPYNYAHRIGRSLAVVAIQTFPGCEDCDYGPGFTVSFFDSPTNQFLEGCEIGHLTPDDIGSAGISVTLFDQEDLRAEAAHLIEHEGASIGEDPEDYTSLDDWLRDYGTRLIQGAMRRYAKRRRRKP